LSGVNLYLEHQDVARLRHAEKLREATRRHALLRADACEVEPYRRPPSTLARLFGRLAPA
jgi:hypothetical protein